MKCPDCGCYGSFCRCSITINDPRYDEIENEAPTLARAELNRGNKKSVPGSNPKIEKGKGSGLDRDA